MLSHEMPLQGGHFGGTILVGSVFSSLVGVVMLFLCYFFKGVTVCVFSAVFWNVKNGVGSVHQELDWKQRIAAFLSRAIFSSDAPWLLVGIVRQFLSAFKQNFIHNFYTFHVSNFALFPYTNVIKTNILKLHQTVLVICLLCLFTWGRVTNDLVLPNLPLKHKIFVVHSSELGPTL